MIRRGRTRKPIAWVRVRTTRDVELPIDGEMVPMPRGVNIIFRPGPQLDRVLATGGVEVVARPLASMVTKGVSP